MKFNPKCAPILLLILHCHSAGQGEDIPQALPLGPVFDGAVTSESGQFRVRGSGGDLRGSVALLAEQTRSELLKLIGETHARFTTPVNISLLPASSADNASRLINKSITFSDQGYQIQVTVPAEKGLNVERFQYTITSALIYERGLAEQTPAGFDSPLLVPPWLVEGIREATRWQLGMSDRRLYEALFRSGGLFSQDDMFNMPETTYLALDAASRAAFQVSSGALVMALLEQPDGKTAFRQLLANVARFTGEMPSLLRRHFPDLNLSENSMAKWWNLQLAQKSEARLTESLTIFETEDALNHALRFHFRDETGNLREEPVDSWPEILELSIDERAVATRAAADSLVRLSYRCFPSYRPILASYQEFIVLIQQEKPQPDTLAAKLNVLTETRDNITSKAERARDYMDWFEITRARETSGAFDDYLRLKKQLRENPRHARSDPLSNMLDRFDLIFHREADSHSANIQWNW